MKRNSKLHIGISTELKDKLKHRADECSMTLTNYCLFILANAIPKVKIPD